MTSSDRNIFRVTGPLWGKSTGYQWPPSHKSQCRGALIFLWCAPKQTAEKTVELLVNWDARMSIWPYDVTYLTLACELLCVCCMLENNNHVITVLQCITLTLQHRYIYIYIEREREREEFVAWNWIPRFTEAHRLRMFALKRKCRHFDEILITGWTGSCQFDNF